MMETEMMLKFPKVPAMVAAGLAALAVTATVSTPAAAQYRDEVRNDMSQCRSGGGPAIMVTVDGIKSSEGRMRVQSYRATSAEWLAKGKWLKRIEAPAKAGTMTFCVPVPATGTYGIAVRHDVNGNGKTDLGSDGGAMSNNPSINIFNLGKPSYKKTAFEVGNAPRTISITMKYM